MLCGLCKCVYVLCVISCWRFNLCLNVVCESLCASGSSLMCLCVVLMMY